MKGHNTTILCQSSLLHSLPVFSKDAEFLLSSTSPHGAFGTRSSHAPQRWRPIVNTAEENPAGNSSLKRSTKTSRARQGAACTIGAVKRLSVALRCCGVARSGLLRRELCCTCHLRGTSSQDVL